MPTIQITITGTPRVINKLNKLSDKVKNFEPEFTTLGEYLTQYFSGTAFMSEGQVFGARWPKLSISYQSLKAKRHPGKQPMEATGTLRRGFKSLAAPKQLTVSNPTPYFKYHQSSKPRTKIPRRVMIGYNNVIKNKAREVISKGIGRVLNGV